MKSLKNIILSIVSFIIIVIIFKIAGLVVEASQWVIILLLILIYFEMIDIANNLRIKRKSN